MKKETYAKEFEEVLKKEKVNKNKLSEALGCSPDQITRLIYSPESANMERFISACNFMGGNVLYDVLHMSSDVRLAHDKPLEGVGKELCEFRGMLDTITKEYKEKGINQDIETVSIMVERFLKKPMVYILGDYSVGKFSLAENLCGNAFKTTGSVIRRCYSSFIVTNTSSSPVKYNYPIGEYLYEITDTNAILPLLSNKLSEEEFNSKTAAAARNGMDKDSDYILYTDLLENDDTTYVCRNIYSISGKQEITPQSADIDSILFNESDVIIFMLGKGEAFWSAITPLLLSCQNRWKKEMLSHIFFLIPKSDRYSNEEIDSETHICEKCLKDILSGIDTELEVKKNIRNRIFPYSSLYKDDENEISTTQLNSKFYKALYTTVSLLCNTQEIAKDITGALNNMSGFFLHKKTFDYQKLSLCKSTINQYVLSSKDKFKEKFSTEYKKILDIDNIISIIDDKNNNISRKQEDRQKLLRIINTQLTCTAMNIAQEEAADLKKKLAEYAKMYDFNIIIDYLKNSPQINEKLKVDYGTKKINSELLQSSIISCLGVGLGAAVSSVAFPVSVIGLVSGATVAAVSYYAQSEATFKKNTAKKIVSEYNSGNIYKKICEKIYPMYFDIIKNDLFIILDNKTNESDEKLTAEYFSRVHDAIQKVK